MKLMSTRFTKILLLFAVCTNSASAEMSAADTKILKSVAAGELTNILFWNHNQQIAGFRNIKTLFPTRPLKTGNFVYPLTPEPQDFTSVRYEIDGKRYSLSDYMNKFNGMGFIIIQGNKILLERYANENTEDTLWVSFSVAKSVTSMLVGAAIQDGFIKSVDEPITDYLPRLKNSAYDKSSIGNILQMSSGVAWNEDYADPKSDVAIAGGLSGVGLYAYLRNLPSDSTPGEKFNYNTGETNLVGSLVRAAIGNNLSTYATTKIWQAFGMESEASWTLNEVGGTELGGCCINATLRDYARIGLFALNEGVSHTGERMLPEGWIKESTTPSNGFDGYGYLWWLSEHSFSALGIYGQSILIHPDTSTVIAMHNAWQSADGDNYTLHRNGLLDALLTHLESH